MHESSLSLKKSNSTPPEKANNTFDTEVKKLRKTNINLTLRIEKLNNELSTNSKMDSHSSMQDIQKSNLNSHINANKTLKRNSLYFTNGFNLNKDNNGSNSSKNSFKQFDQSPILVNTKARNYVKLILHGIITPEKSEDEHKEFKERKLKTKGSINLNDLESFSSPRKIQFEPIRKKLPSKTMLDHANYNKDDEKSPLKIIKRDNNNQKLFPPIPIVNINKEEDEQRDLNSKKKFLDLEEKMTESIYIDENSKNELKLQKNNSFNFRVREKQDSFRKNLVKTGSFKKAGLMVSSFIKKVFLKDQENNISNLSKSILKKKLMSFDSKDLEFLSRMKKRQENLLNKEISILSLINKKLNLSRSLHEKWLRARNSLKFGIKVNKFNEDIKIYGSSANAGLELDNRKNLKIVVDKLLVKQETLTRKKNMQTLMIKGIMTKTLFHPNDKFIIFWGYIMSILLIYTATFTPYREIFIDYESFSLTLCDYFTDSLFLLDIMITLNLAFFNKNDKLVSDRGKIFWNYFKSWLLIDILGIFPFQFLETSSEKNQDIGGYTDFAKLLKLPRLYRLIKISRLYKLSKKRSNSLSLFVKIQYFLRLTNSVVQIFKFVCTVIFFVHIMGCLWYLEAKLQGFSIGTWIYELGFVDNENFDNYLRAIYWAVSTLCTVGYGDIRAFNDVEYVLSIIWMIFGAGFYSYTIGTLSNMIMSVDSRKGKLNYNLAVLDQFCRVNKLGQKLKLKIIDCFYYSFNKNYLNSFEKEEFFNEIPTDLKYDIASNMCSDLQKNVNFFHNKDEVFFADFVMLLQPLFQPKGEIIYKKKEYPHSMYFLISGKIAYITGEQNLCFKCYNSGSYFGEIEILSGSARNFSILALTNCNLLTISKEGVLHILKRFPEYEFEMIQIAKKRQKKIMKSYTKVQNLSNISKNSALWNIQRSVNYYEIIKEKYDPTNFYYLQNINSLEIINKKRPAKIPKFFHNKIEPIILEPIKYKSNRLNNEIDALSGIYKNFQKHTEEINKEREEMILSARTRKTSESPKKKMLFPSKSERKMDFNQTFEEIQPEKEILSQSIDKSKGKSSIGRNAIMDRIKEKLGEKKPELFKKKSSSVEKIPVSNDFSPDLLSPKSCYPKISNSNKCKIKISLPKENKKEEDFKKLKNIVFSQINEKKILANKLENFEKQFEKLKNLLSSTLEENKSLKNEIINSKKNLF